MAHASGGRASQPTAAELGLRVLAKNDGTWLEFLTTDGQSHAVHMESIADDLCREGGPQSPFGQAIRRWCADQQHARTARRLTSDAPANPPVDPKHERLSDHHAAKEKDEEVEAMSEDSFPASDPPSFSPPRTGSPAQSSGNKRH
jgi:hypothetical protein